MKRITIFKNGTPAEGRLLLVSPTHTFEEILEECSLKLELNAKALYTAQGALVDNVVFIRDEDVFYVSDGKPFMGPSKPQAAVIRPRSFSSISPRNDCKRHSRTPTEGTTTKCTCSSSEWVTLNVGGHMFTTTRSTLTQQEPESMLARMFCDEDQWYSSVDGSGAYLIDRSPRYFEPILNYLRHGQLVLDKDINPEGVLEEAKFFGLTSLMEILDEVIEKNQVPDDSTPINRREFVLRLLSTPTNKELRCQGMNFTNANLSKLDLRYINFKYAVLKNANLSGANLSYCNFERADLCHAVLDSANLLGVKMLCANMEGTSLRGCNFEDPAGSRANMEGALMKSVNLEGSHMAGVNLRVATLKNANLQNCDLRGAVLAGADLENCDMSGCDLQEANLRGANLKGAALKLMLNPLHMAQTVR